MILITGMPRTASSFLNMWFYYTGKGMIPKCFSEYMATNRAMEQNLRYNLCEPIQLTHDLSYSIITTEGIIKGLDKISFVNKEKIKDSIPVVKCSPLAFRKDCLYKFNKVIVCIRDIKSWIESAENHGTFAWIDKAKPLWLENHYNKIINSSNKYEEFAKVWQRQSVLTYEYCINKGIPCDIYEYSSDDSFKKLHLSYGLEPKKHEDYSYWIKRRF